MKSFRELSDNEINYIIADIVGFKRPYSCYHTNYSSSGKVFRDDNFLMIPEYYLCLNSTSCFEALLKDKLEDYWSELSFICQRDFNLTKNKLHRQSASATARQRCEAFINVMTRKE